MSPKCENCDGHVTKDFARVFGNDENKVIRCTDCLEDMNGSRSELLKMGAAGKENFRPAMTGLENL